MPLGIFTGGRFLFLQSKQFVMASKAQEVDDVVVLVNPNEQEVALNMTLHATLVPAMKHVGTHGLGKRQPFF